MLPYYQPRRSQRDDAAPTDWSYAHTMQEGHNMANAAAQERRAAMQEKRRRVNPFEAMQEAQEAPRRVTPAPPADSPFRMPGTPVYPSGTAQTEQVPEGARRVEARTMQPRPEPPAPPPEESPRRRAQIVTEDGSAYEKPAVIELPQWYRVAQQNVNLSGRKPQPPRVQSGATVSSDPQAAPMRQADVYAASGYPEELLAQQRQLDLEQEKAALRTRHGAQAAKKEPEPAPEPVPPRASTPASPMGQRRALSQEELSRRLQAAQTASRSPAYHQPVAQPQWQEAASAPDPHAPWTVTEDDEPRPRIPWLGLLTAAALLLAIGLWIGQMSMNTAIDKLYAARQQEQVRIAEAHPYEYRELIEAQAEQYNLHPAFVAAIILNESSYRPHVTSSANAMGLMQIRPDTADYINRALEMDGFSYNSLYDPETNIRFGCYYLGELSRRFHGDPVLVAAAYNAGPTNVQNWLNNSLYSADQRTLPIENIPFGDTKTYAGRVLRDYAAYKRLYYEYSGG